MFNDIDPCSPPVLVDNVPLKELLQPCSQTALERLDRTRRQLCARWHRLYLPSLNHQTHHRLALFPRASFPSPHPTSPSSAPPKWPSQTGVSPLPSARRSLPLVLDALQADPPACPKLSFRVDVVDGCGDQSGAGESEGSTERSARRGREDRKDEGDRSGRWARRWSRKRSPVRQSSCCCSWFRYELTWVFLGSFFFFLFF